MRRNGQQRQYRQCEHGSQYHPGAANPAGSLRLASADRVRGERRYRNQYALADHGECEVERRSKPRCGERGAAQASNHHRVGQAHRHLGKIRAGERRGQGEHRANFAAHHGAGHRHPRSIIAQRARTQAPTVPAASRYTADPADHPLTSSTADEGPCRLAARSGRHYRAQR